MGSLSGIGGTFSVANFGGAEFGMCTFLRSRCACKPSRTHFLVDERASDQSGWQSDTGCSRVGSLESVAPHAWPIFILL